MDEPKADLNSGLDLHSKDGQFCVDISNFLDLEWVEREAEECATAFEQKCEEKTEEICLTVNETLCEVSNNAFLEIPVIGCGSQRGGDRKTGNWTTSSE